MTQNRNLLGCQVFEKKHLPQGWACEPLEERIELAYGRGLSEAQRRVGGINVFGSNGKVGLHHEALVNGPGVLVGRKGSVGAVHFTASDFWPIDTVYYVIPLKGDDLLFLYYLLQYLPLDKLNAATGVPGLSRRDAYALRGVFPPVEEQKQIANILQVVDSVIARTCGGIAIAKALQVSLFKDACDLVDSLIRSVPMSKAEALIQLKLSLLKCLLTGTVRVNHLDLRAVDSGE